MNNQYYFATVFYMGNHQEEDEVTFKKIMNEIVQEEPWTASNHIED